MTKLINRPAIWPFETHPIDYRYSSISIGLSIFTMVSADEKAKQEKLAAAKKRVRPPTNFQSSKVLTSQRSSR